jgi:ferredoxin-NADP reductase/DMSO/TMAO reductase YedYZ heme-binding membrane subunit
MSVAPIYAPVRRLPQAAPVWFGGSMPFARLAVIVNLMVPGAVLFWDALHQQLGVNAVNFAIKTTGLVAVTYLVLSLAVTPLRAVTGLSWLVQFRRAIGCFACYYAAAHLTIYFWFDRSHSLSSTVYEITHRWYLAIGFTSLVLMLPLLLTSFNSAIRWLGGKKWKLLHRLAYVAAALGCWHFYLQSKADKSKPDVYFVVLAGLLLWRVGAGLIDFARHRNKSASASAMATSTPGKVRFWKGELKVVAIFRETNAVRTFRFAMPDGGPIPFSYKAGQFLSLSVPIDGKRVTRSYTIASSPTRDAYVELTIKREDRGRVSGFLHEMLMTGHTVSVSAPAGKFTFMPERGESGVLLIAGGVGITPCMSILRDLTDRGWSGKIDLLFVVRTAEDVIFADELKYLAARHPNLHVHVSITRDAPADWKGPRGRLTIEMVRQLVPDFLNQSTFICGPDAMATHTREMLAAAGMSNERIIVESFTPAAAVARDANALPADEMNDAAIAVVTFERSNQTAQLTAKKTVLEAAESAGVAFDYQCRAGICGTCRCRLLDGEVTMENRDALSDAEIEEGYILACQATSSADIRVDA